MERIEFNVTITNDELSKLKESAIVIENTINDIKNIYSELNDDVWLSPEKKKLDEYLIPYIEEKKKYHISHLNNYNETFRVYSDTYNELINKIADGVNYER